MNKLFALCISLLLSSCVLTRAERAKGVDEFYANLMQTCMTTKAVPIKPLISEQYGHAIICKGASKNNQKVHGAWILDQRGIYLLKDKLRRDFGPYEVSDERSGKNTYILSDGISIIQSTKRAYTFDIKFIIYVKSKDHTFVKTAKKSRSENQESRKELTEAGRKIVGDLHRNARRYKAFKQKREPEANNRKWAQRRMKRKYGTDITYDANGKPISGSKTRRKNKKTNYFNQSESMKNYADQQKHFRNANYWEARHKTISGYGNSPIRLKQTTTEVSPNTDDPGARCRARGGIFKPGGHCDTITPNRPKSNSTWVDPCQGCKTVQQ